MFLEFFFELRKHGIPVSLHEYLSMMDALKKEVASMKVEDFYALSRCIFVKKEIHLDRFDIIFSTYFKERETLDDDFFMKIPEEWLKVNLDRQLTEEEKAMIEAMGGPEALMERLRELMKEQKERHEGGNRWIGTGGTSPFGNGGYNPEGYKIGKSDKGQKKALKVWEKRQFANLSDKVEIDTRSMKMALRRLRKLTREGMQTELDLPQTIHKTSHNGGMLDIHMVAQRKNNVKVLMLMDIGGSMDEHVELCSRLFSASRHEFKHLEFFYFHNCLYESVWKDNVRRWSDRIPTLDLLNKFNSDYKVIFVGDACMSPYEIMYSGGAVEHYNDEPGAVWLERFRDHFQYTAWINPMPESSWTYYDSTAVIQEIFRNR
ncbi:MAG: VWA domain-containing protein, partial [Bacteroidota bacterium]